MRAAALLMVALLLTACEPEIPGGEPAAASENGPETAAGSQTLSLGGVDLTAPLSLIGTEPFWSIKVSPADIVFSSPEEKGRSFVAVPAFINGNQATLKSGALEAVLKPGPCSDGMSDRVYPLTAEVTLDGKTLKGCALTTAQMEASKP